MRRRAAGLSTVIVEVRPQRIPEGSPPLLVAPVVNDVGRQHAARGGEGLLVTRNVLHRSECRAYPIQFRPVHVCGGELLDAACGLGAVFGADNR
ncbi:hypothetical protein [Nocardia sp. CA-119907]|uniref:hypothetical protein n=1 Tax=Nocardia sp. CA-119907 TaxID=3239973 RepID=UPI003D9983A8